MFHIFYTKLFIEIDFKLDIVSAKCYVQYLYAQTHMEPKECGCRGRRRRRLIESEGSILVLYRPKRAASGQSLYLFRLCTYGVQVRGRSIGKLNHR